MSLTLLPCGFSAGLGLWLWRFQQVEVIRLQQQIPRNQRGGSGSLTAVFTITARRFEDFRPANKSQLFNPAAFSNRVNSFAKSLFFERSQILFAGFRRMQLIGKSSLVTKTPRSVLESVQSLCGCG